MAHHSSLTTQHLLTLRREYQSRPLLEREAGANPFRFFHKWFDEADKAELPEPNAMVLSTVDKKGHPSSRVVLLKEATKSGFVFFTSYQSLKAKDILFNPHVSLLFFWNELHRQVRIDGKAAKIKSEDSDYYFQLRPRGAQLGAWASRQSSVLASRKELESRVSSVEGRFHEREIPRPKEWGGYEVIPTRFEFWQGRESRLHDRLLFKRRGPKGSYTLQRLSP